MYLYFLKIMVNTTISLSKDVYTRLQIIKHKHEKKNVRSYSFNKILLYLIEKEEKNG